MRDVTNRYRAAVGLTGLFLGGLFGFACGDDAMPTSHAPSDGGSDSLQEDHHDVAPDAAAEAQGSNRMVLDQSFGVGGKVILAEGDTLPARDVRGVVVQSSGHLVIGLADFDGPAATDLIRLTATGAHDGTFGEDGGVSATKLVFGQLVPSPNSDALVVAGDPTAAGACEVARYLAGGTLDPAYGTGGRANGGAGGGIPVVQADGKVLSGLSGGSIVNRLDTSGKLDTTFGHPAGYAIVKPITRYSFRALAPQADGQIVVAGDEHDDAGLDYGCLLIRVTSGGGVDQSFGTAGETFLGDGCGSVRGVTVTSDAKIVVRATKAPDLSLHLVRLTSTGTVDPTYAPTQGIFDPHSNAVPLAGDRLTFLALSTDQRTFGAWRISASGGIDPTFAPAGVRTMDERWSRNAMIALQPDGKMVVAGLIGKALVVARYLP